jgi:pyruvate dehydrogenase E2 component (dihydrolipoamide acetyltransferase)
MTLKEFRLPDIGEGIAEGEIVKWRVEVGQQVSEEDDFVEVMTDKATVMITVPWDGVIAELRFKDGDVVPVESVMAVIDTSGGGSAAATEERSAASAPETPVAAPVTATALKSASPGKVLAAPATRRRAREMGIDLQLVRGTGPRGRITVEDLTDHLGRPQREVVMPAATPAPARPATPPPRPAPGQREQRVPLQGLRRKIAEAMTRSKSTAAHFTYVDDLEVTELVKIRRAAKAAFADKGVNITYMPFIMKAVVEAMRAYPAMNSSLDESAQELVIKHYYNFGFATDTDNGLIVPVVKDVDQKSISALAREIQDLAQRTRDGKVTRDDLTGGTFTITNAGNIGGLFATPIINYPEAAILGVHAIKKTPVVRDGEIVVGEVMYLSVSIDHRIVDGATGAHWMNVVKQYLENPSLLLLGSM